MRLIALALALVSFAGCLDTSPDPVQDVRVDWYLYDYPGWDVASSSLHHGYLLQVTNNDTRTLRIGVLPIMSAGSATAYHPGPVAFGITAHAAGAQETLFYGVAMAPGESVLWQIEASASSPATGFDLLVDDWNDARSAPATVVGERWTLTPAAGLEVSPGDHVQTATVGVWTNGTSFYTNIQALNADPAFPAGYDRSEFGGAPLPIFAYRDDRTEQPVGSKDTCHFTTITGYNQLLLAQQEGSTMVRYLEPREAYTVAGAEDHFLYGEPLIFMNTIVAHDGATGALDALPNPNGACFDAQNTVDFVTDPLPV